ncbi:MAG: M28 family peptidase [Planctomycetes bacterium]|nr:M28 family peptidase [Planctomycetota bacterium]
MTPWLSLLLVAFLDESAARGAGGTAPIVLPKLAPEITRQEVEAHVRFLASDELGGRVTGTPGCERAAEYIAAVLRAQGAAPAGDGGTFFQDVALERVRLAAAPRLTFIAADGVRTELAHGTDFDAPWTAVAAEGLRLVVVRTEAEVPSAAARDVALFVDASASDRRRWLAAAGHADGAGFGAILAPGSRRAGRPRDPAALVGAYRRTGVASEQGSLGVVRLHGPVLEALRATPPAGVSLVVDASIEVARSANVVARIPGRAPRASARAVVISAHYDHISHGPGQDGADRIYNGADDDASGVAAVLEIAGALGQGGELEHDVIVLLATAEEIGLLGTEEYLDRPVVPLERTILNLNFEMVGRPDEKVGGPGVLWLTGDERTNLGAFLRERGLRVAADPRPEQNFFERSDNYAFVRRGVIGQTLSSYGLHADYHRPSDEADTLDYEHLAAAARTGEKAVRLVAEGAVALAWASGKSPAAPR